MAEFLPHPALVERILVLGLIPHMENPHKLYHFSENPPTRRGLLRAAGCGFGYLAMAAMMAEEQQAQAATLAAAASPMAPKPPHFAPSAKRVIFLFMHGGPSSVDTFDPKPRLVQDDGKPVPFKRGLTFGEDAVRGLLKAQWPFKQYGQSGIAVSDLFPNVATCVDDL